MRLCYWIIIFFCNFLFVLSSFISSSFQNILSFSWQEIDKWKLDRLNFSGKNEHLNKYLCHTVIVATFTKQVHFLENWNYIFCCTHPQSCLTLVTPCTAAHQAPLSMGFSRQEYWSGLPFPTKWDLLNPGIELTLTGGFFNTELLLFVRCW